MSTNPNTVKSQDELNEGGRKSDVLVATLEKCERLQKQLDIAVKALELAKGFYGYCRMKGYTVALSHDFNDDYEKINNTLAEIQELNK